MLLRMACSLLICHQHDGELVHGEAFGVEDDWGLTQVMIAAECAPRFCQSGSLENDSTVLFRKAGIADSVSS